jgi:hypothetical protein
MESTSIGPNRTGGATHPEGIELMLEAVSDLSPPVPISTLGMDIERQRYITEADSVGSIPPATDTSLSILLDKLGERLAFERTGTRLYGALITKYLALVNAGEEPLPPADTLALSGTAAKARPPKGEAALDTLRRIRAEELSHFLMLGELITQLGGDPTALTPCADVTAAASMGLMQVLNDPRTTLAQCLNTLLTAELTDNAGWELLSDLAQSAGQSQLLDPFAQALAAEQQHLAIVRGWLKALVTEAPGTPAV